MSKEKMKAIKGLIFVAGLIIAIIGGATDLYPAHIGGISAVIIWLAGGAIVKFYFVKASEAQSPQNADDHNNGDN